MKQDKSKRILIWGTDLDRLREGTGRVGGILVQMNFWGELLNSRGFRVFSFTTRRNNRNRTLNGITFSYAPPHRFIGPLQEVFRLLRTLLVLRPEAVLVRGATRSLVIPALLAPLFGCKTVLLFASDSDLMPGRELIRRSWDRWLFRCGIRLCRRFVCQNRNQQELLERHYRKHGSVLIPNIWLRQELPQRERTAILWVSNFRALKRPGWFLELARRFPQERFVMAGGSGDRGCYKAAEREAASLPNVEFLGAQSFTAVNRLFRSARIFVCTSEMEGFPNTFLQAWENGIPVLTTFDPGRTVEENHLGTVAGDIGTLAEALERALREPAERKAVREYFDRNYSGDSACDRLMELLKRR